MSMIETVTLWNEGVGQWDDGQAQTALSTFSRINQPSSKILFNMGCCHFSIQQYQQAIQYMTAAIEKDEHLAVAYMLRGIIHCTLKRLSEALSDFDHCLQKLRGKHVVDYGQLGMRYKLFACEPLYNLGVVYARMGDTATALHYMTEAEESPTEIRHAPIVKGLNALKAKNLSAIQLWVLPTDAIFRPARSKVVNIGKKDYLGKAKVVSSAESRKVVSVAAVKQVEQNKERRPSPAGSPIPPHRLLRLPEGHQKGQRSKSLDRLNDKGEGHSDTRQRYIQRDVSPCGRQKMAPPALPSKLRRGSEPVFMETNKRPVVARPAPPPPPPPSNKQSSPNMSGKPGRSTPPHSIHSQRVLPTSTSVSVVTKPALPRKPSAISTGHSFKNGPNHCTQTEPKLVLPPPAKVVQQEKPTGVRTIERTEHSASFSRSNIPPPPQKPVPRTAPMRMIP